MALERTHEGLETTLKPHGIARFFAAGFLSVWLCGWAAGETFAVYALANGALGLADGKHALHAGGLAVGAFLMVWLSLWTLGGIFALREWLRLMWSEDRILVAPEGLRIHRRCGPFRRTTTIARPDIEKIYTMPRRSRLLAATPRGTVEITALANRLECATLEQDLREALDLSANTPAAAAPEKPPEGWAAVADADGYPAVVQDPAIRATQAKVAWAFTSLLAIPTLLLLSRILDRPQWGGLAALLAAATVLSAWGSWRLAATRLEWRLDSGRLSLRRRSGSGALDLFEGTSLELVERSDSDGDAWFTLNAIAADGVKRWKIEHAMADPSVPRGLGAWIAARASIPFDDRATETRRVQDLAAALAQLEASGRLGRWVARALKRT